MDEQEHYCNNPDIFPTNKYFKKGIGKGSKILIVGEAPAPNGWRKSGKAFYTVNGVIVPTGKNLNKLLQPFDLSIDNCAFTELIKCYVGKDRKLLLKCGRKCWSIFIRQISTVDFKLLILLGLKTLDVFNVCTNSSLVVGKLEEMNINGKKYQVLPLYHPSPISPYNNKKNLEIIERLHNQIVQVI